MRIEFRVRSAIGLSLMVLTAAMTAGATIPRPADHDDRTPHVEVGHGGHGHVIAVQSEQARTQFAHFVFTLPLEPAAWDRVAECTHSMHCPKQVTHLGRDPPASTRPRAPPYS